MPAQASIHRTSHAETGDQAERDSSSSTDLPVDGGSRSTTAPACGSSWTASSLVASATRSQTAGLQRRSPATWPGSWAQNAIRPPLLWTAGRRRFERCPPVELPLAPSHRTAIVPPASAVYKRASSAPNGYPPPRVPGTRESSPRMRLQVLFEPLVAAPAMDPVRFAGPVQVP